MIHLAFLMNKNRGIEEYTLFERHRRERGGNILVSLGNVVPVILARSRVDAEAKRKA